MELAQAWVVIDRQGSNVFRRGITPAEAVILQKMHGGFVGGNPVTQIEITGKAQIVTERDGQGKANGHRDRKDKEELGRLTRKYGGYKVKGVSIVESLYPGASPILPETFEEAGFESGKLWQQQASVDKQEINRNPSDDDFSVLAVAVE